MSAVHPVVRVAIDDHAAFLHPRYLDRFVGLPVVWTSTWDGTSALGTVERFEAGWPIVRFPDGRWARGDAFLDVVETAWSPALAAPPAGRAAALAAEAARYRD